MTTQTNHVLDDKAIDLATKLARGEGNVSKLKEAFVKYMRDDLGFVSTDLVAPAKDASKASKEEWADLKAMATKTLPKAVQALLDMPSSEVNNRRMRNGYTGKPQTRTYWVKQPNSVISRWRKALHDAELADVKAEYGELAAAAEAAGKKAPAKPEALKNSGDHPVSERVQTLLSDAIKFVRKHDGNDNFDIQDIEKAISAIETCSEAVKKVTTTKKKVTATKK